jgi:hypothetical protein
MSTSGRRCTICQAPASRTGSSRLLRQYREYRCARAHLLELVGADAARTAPEGCRFVGFAAFGGGTCDVSRSVLAGDRSGRRFATGSR